MLAFIKRLNSFFSSLQRRSSLVLEDLSVNPKNPQLGTFEWILPWLDLLVLFYAGLDRINYWRHLIIYDPFLMTRFRKRDTIAFMGKKMVKKVKAAGSYIRQMNSSQTFC